MSQEAVIDLVRDGLYTVILAAAPPLLLGLIVGLLVSIFQTVTSIQEQTLAFVPKILAVLLSLVIFGPFILNTLTGYMIRLYSSFPSIITPP